jgi:hypothetical protein
MYQNEPLAEYLEHKLRCLAAFDPLYTPAELAANKPSKQAATADFIDGLNDRFIPFKTDLINNVQAKIEEYPETIEIAVRKASQYKVVTKSTTGNMLSSFVTEAVAPIRQQKVDNQRKPKDKSISKFKPKFKYSSKYANKGARDNNKSRKCNICGEEGHFMNDCSLKAQFSKFLKEKGSLKTNVTASYEDEFEGYVSATTFCSVIKTEVEDDNEQSEDIINLSSNATTLSTVLSSSDILLDCQSQGHLFSNRDLVTNIRPSKRPMTFAGVGGPIKVTQIAHYPPLDIDVAFHESAPVNLLSFGKVMKKVGKDRIGYNSNNNSFFFIGCDGIRRDFINKKDLYVYSTDTDIQINATSNENEKQYSKRDVDKAREAREIERRLGYPSVARIIDAINSGAIIEVPVVSQDFARNHRIWGPAVAAIQGKTHNQKTSIEKINMVPRVVTDIHMHCDIMFVTGNAFLISVGVPIGLTITTHLGTMKDKARSVQLVRKAELFQVNLYKAAQFNVRIMSTDNEAAFISSQEELARVGVTLNCVGAGKHVPIVENKIKTIKETARTLLASLSYTFPTKLTRWLIAYSTYVINILPNKGGHQSVSPREAFLGRKTSLKRDLRVGFGDYCQVTNAVTDNSLKPRTSGAIALCPTGNLQGSIKFFLLHNEEIVVRDQFVILPVTEDVARRMSQIENESIVKVDIVDDTNVEGEVRTDIEDMIAIKYLPAERKVSQIDSSDAVDKIISADTDNQIVYRKEELHQVDNNIQDANTSII